MYLFLSPHFDDAVLSCGATIHQLAAAGEQVVVLTVMGGKPESTRIPDTPIIRELHARWEEGTDPVSARLREDEAAITSLGAQAQHLVVWMDCIYRTSRSGQPLYTTVDSIFADTIPADDPAAKWLPTVILPLVANSRFLYAPLGAGNHVDHQIVRNWALELKKQNPPVALKFYEEYPYTEDNLAVDKALSFFSSHKPIYRLQSETVQVTETDVNAKLDGIACYTSQISSFWDSIETMKTATRNAMIKAGGGSPSERYWTLVEH